MAAVLATEGSFHDAKPAIKFLYMYFYGTLKHHKIEAAGRALSGRLLEQVRRQLLALREAPLDGKTTGYPEERGEEAALGRLHAHAAVLLQLLLALRWACLQPRVADSPEIAEALLAVSCRCRCHWHLVLLFPAPPR